MIFSLSLILKNYSINGIKFLFTESSFLSFFFLFCNDLHCDALVFRQQCPAEALLLPQKIPLKFVIWNLRREVRHLTKKSKKMDDELHRLRKSHSKATAKVTHLRDLHKKGFMDYTWKKADFVKELEELQKCVSDRSWTQASKISSLEVELAVAWEKIGPLEGSCPGFQLRLTTAGTGQRNFSTFESSYRMPRQITTLTESAGAGK